MSAHTPPPHLIEVSGRDPFGTRIALVNGHGELLLPPELKSVYVFRPDGQGSTAAGAQALDGRWGYLRGDGQWLVPPQFHQAKNFSDDGIGRFEQAGQWGFMRSDGTLVAPPQYVDCQPFEAGFAAVRIDGKWGFIDARGELVLAPQWTAVGRFSRLPDDSLRASFGRNNKVGLIDGSGNEVVAPQFAEILGFGPGGLAPARDLQDKWGLIDGTGQWRVPPAYGRIREFNDDGLAYYEEVDYWYQGGGYLKADGELAFKGDRDLSKAMVAGLCRLGSYCSKFVGIDGEVRIPQRFDWADHFDTCGAAVARLDGQWGILRSNGDFLAVPLPEAGTDDGYVMGFRRGHGLAPFTADDGSVHWYNAEGRPCYQVGRSAAAALDHFQATLRNAGGQLLWRSEPAKDVFYGASIELNTGPAQHFNSLDHWHGDIVAVARQLLEQPAQTFYPMSLVFGGDRDVYDLEDLEEDDEEYFKNGALEVLAQHYVDESHWGAYQFLDGHVAECFQHYFNTLRDRLGAHFGPPDPDPDFGTLRHGDSNTAAVWPLEGRDLVLELMSQSGDGDFEYQLWLAAVERE